MNKPFKPIINKISNYIEDKKFKKEIEAYKDNYISEKETRDMLFIWGVISYDDLSQSKEANLYTMNDLDIIYHKDEEKYSISVETIYVFSTIKAKYNYMQSLLDEFTKWMEENNYETDITFSLYKVFTDGISINTKYNSIEETYAAFKMIVNGYCSLAQN